MKTNVKTYSELIRLLTFQERYEYLKLNGIVGKETFGFDRYMYQIFCHSQRWKQIRDKIIIRDNGCDLAVEGHDIYGRILIHHMNPITLEDIERESEYLLNPEYLITVTHRTHNAIHYGDEHLLMMLPKERSKNDTCPWRR